MGVSTTHRINLSMWILMYSFSDKYYVWAACDIKRNAIPRLSLVQENDLILCCVLEFCMAKVPAWENLVL